MTQATLLGAIEAGGTKFICALGRGPDEIVAEARIPTTTPAATLQAVVDFFRSAQRAQGEAEAFGIGSFGPVQLDRRAVDYGCILPTPKPGWQGADLIAPVRQAFGKPVGLDTDVNAAALAEHQLGAGRGARSLTYITVGTGIGGGLIVDGRLVHGVMHPELGHLLVRRDPRDLAYPGHCPFHGDCLEGLACGPAISARWGKSLDQLGARHEATDIIGYYLAQLATSVALMHSSEHIVFGGGVSGAAGLISLIRAHAVRLLNGYLPSERYRGDLSAYVIAPGLGDRSGRVGALLLAQQALLASPLESGVAYTR